MCVSKTEKEEVREGGRGRGRQREAEAEGGRYKRG